MKSRARTTLLAVAIGCLLVQATPISQAQCPGDITYVSSYSVAMISTGVGMGAGNPLYDFIGAGCSTMKFGLMPPSTCGDFATFVTAKGSFEAVLYASWSMSTSNTSNNGCTFVCPGGTCRLRGGDGLPVELMDFSIED